MPPLPPRNFIDERHCGAFNRIAQNQSNGFNEFFAIQTWGGLGFGLGFGVGFGLGFGADRAGNAYMNVNGLAQDSR